jgi:formate hydrogenlyase subunit 6/NADH:ubiquinone oxidoreductase subunit I
VLRMLKQGILKKGIVTKNYPAEPFSPEEGYLGMPEVDASLCNKCGECAKACPSGAIRVMGRVEISLDRCIFCAACQTACPVNAVRMTSKYEMASRSVEDMKVTY